MKSILVSVFHPPLYDKLMRYSSIFNLPENMSTPWTQALQTKTISLKVCWVAYTVYADIIVTQGFLQQVWANSGY